MGTKSMMLVIAIACTVGVSSRPIASARSERLSELRNVKVDYGDVADIVNGYSEIIGIDGAPGLPDAGIVVHSPRKGVLYLANDGSVLKVRRVNRRQAISLSSDGAIIGVLDMGGLDGGVPNKLTIESAAGDVLWRRDDGFGRGETGYAPVLVTSRGYAIVSSNRHPRGLGNGKIAHPLIFDASGDLVAELPATYTYGNMSVSKDGSYLAISFCDLDAGEDAMQDDGGIEPSAKPCVALYEIASGLELWRRYFGYCGPRCMAGAVAVAKSAHRVVCGGQDKGVPSGAVEAAAWYSMYVLDRSGNVVSANVMENGFGSITLSPGDHMAAVRTSSLASDSLVAVDLEDGRIVYRWGYSERAPHRCYVASVSDSCVMAVRVIARNRVQGTSRVRRWVLVDSRGGTIWDQQIDETGRSAYLFSKDGTVLRKLTAGGLIDYAVPN